MLREISSRTRTPGFGTELGAQHAAGLQPPLSGLGGRAVRHGNPRLDGFVQKTGLDDTSAGADPGRGQRAPGTGGADGGDVGGIGGRDAAGAPRFDQAVPSGGYLWWYFDALSDDGRHGITVIAFVGSVFSPYYAWARGRAGSADPENHCCLNVALYGAGAGRWCMTERGQRWVQRDACSLQIGPSRVQWDGNALVVDVDEVAVPFPHRVRGRVRLTPQALCSFVTPLDAAGRHRWGPIAPIARVEVDFPQPGLKWQGHAYLDSNEGDEPIDRPFRVWDWARAPLSDGSTAVIYDVQPKQGPDRVIAQRFARDGSATAFEAPSRQGLPRSKWTLDRRMRTEPGTPARVLQTLEDTPFYVRSTVQAGLLGQTVTAMHESISLSRVASLPVRLMLPWRMPRRG